MNTVLKQSIPYGYDSQGYVYALTWPAVPGYIKIGYTRNTVESRRAEFEYCQPGIQFLHAVDVAFPKRVERLLHLELSSTRHQITICPQCAGTHYEWFRIPETTAIRTLSAWRTLSEDNGLYSTSRQLLLPWIRRVDDLDSPATAQALLSIRTAEVQAEAAVQAAARYAAREVHERVEAVAHAEALRIQAACASAQMVKEQAQAEALRVQAARLTVRMFEEKTRADALRVQAAQNIALVDAAESLVRNEMTGTAGQVETVDRKPAKIRSGTPKELNLDTILDAFRDFGRMVMINIP